MVQFRSISILHFKNYKQRSFLFTNRIAGICGKNGTGKTNLLDAIYYCCFTKSYFTRPDANIAHHGELGFRLEADLSINNKNEKVVCVVRENGKKEMSVNGEYYDKLSQHVGRYPCVMIAPDDVQLIIGGSEERRRFMDIMICQLDTDYLQHLSKHNKLLLQRNSLLKSFAETGKRDLALLDVLDEQVAAHAGVIYQKRKYFMTSFLPDAAALYNEISQLPEPVSLQYESELQNNSCLSLLKANRNRDCQVQRTTSGIHRDDLLFNLNNQPFKNIASQGQRKSLLFALKLAEMDKLKKEKGFAPLLLLDDVFEKLDEGRIASLLRRVCVENDGQVFITDTHAERLQSHLEALGSPYAIIKL